MSIKSVPAAESVARYLLILVNLLLFFIPTHAARHGDVSARNSHRAYLAVDKVSSLQSLISATPCSGDTSSIAGTPKPIGTVPPLT